MSRIVMCPVCLGEGRVYRMTAAYEATAAAAAGGSFGWTGPTHEWRSCKPCLGQGVFPPRPVHSSGFRPMRDGIDYDSSEQ